ncbi:hypothetical protein [Allosphingosinicella indica]|uniref:Uncharacterized protein n=1 Tax=Allosphingosinicella indica TaxID=941907 RepID=A0A1X7G689_9SPHN|nr:hypothetical protein [Allosphingosinicella indica]SMF64732.1 hypothetical protein SAMN06295910_1230 [Allosphingosinicella indica]
MSLLLAFLLQNAVLTERRIDDFPQAVYPYTGLYVACLDIEMTTLARRPDTVEEAKAAYRAAVDVCRGVREIASDQADRALSNHAEFKDATKRGDVISKAFAIADQACNLCGSIARSSKAKQERN